VNVLEAAIRRAVADLARYRCAWALIGGFAVAARAEPRFTHDIDVAVAVADDAGAESLVRWLIQDGYRPLTSIEQDDTDRLATVRLASAVADGDVVIDLLFASSGIEMEIVSAAQLIEIIPGLTVPIATTGHLIALKLLARDDESRPQDLADLRALLAVATRADVDLARESVRLITERGYSRGRDLEAALDGWTAQ
jgi:predicted nucleotidyltransferase